MDLGKGFSLLETMLVIALIGILASFAIPAYQDYLIRARVTEGMGLAMPAKLAVNEYYAHFKSLPTNPEALHYQSPEATHHVASITVGQHGVIGISYTENAGNGSLILSPNIQKDGRITWCCDGGSLAPKYRPHACRC
jgi:type IV pilus assembly protein PilA